MTDQKQNFAADAAALPPRAPAGDADRGYDRIETDSGHVYDRLCRATGTTPPPELPPETLDEEERALADIREIARSYPELRGHELGEQPHREVASGSTPNLPTVGKILIPSLEPVEVPGNPRRMQIRLLAMTSVVCAAVGATIVALSAALT